MFKDNNQRKIAPYSQIRLRLRHKARAKESDCCSQSQYYVSTVLVLSIITTCFVNLGVFPNLI